MPRPLNWVRGEGTVKNQRWGLGSVMDTPFVPGGLNGMQPRLGYSGLGFALATEQPSVVRSEGDIFTTQIDKYGDYNGVIGTAGSNTVGDWLKQNWVLVAAGVVGIMLLKRR